MAQTTGSADSLLAPDLCQHHWVIDTPNGAVSGGRCKRCGEERQFRNSQEDLLWDSDGFSLGGSRVRSRRIGEN